MIRIFSFFFPKDRLPIVFPEQHKKIETASAQVTSSFFFFFLKKKKEKRINENAIAYEQIIPYSHGLVVVELYEPVP